MVGLDEVLQQIPRAVTFAPPSAVTLPPQTAEFVVIWPAACVLTVATLLPAPYTQRTEIPVEADKV